MSLQSRSRFESEHPKWYFWQKEGIKESKNDDKRKVETKQNFKHWTTSMFEFALRARDVTAVTRSIQPSCGNRPRRDECFLHFNLIFNKNVEPRMKGACPGLAWPTLSGAKFNQALSWILSQECFVKEGNGIEILLISFDVKNNRTNERPTDKQQRRRPTTEYNQEKVFFLKMVQPRPLLSFIFGLFKQTSIQIFITNQCDNVHRVYGAGIKPTTFGTRASSHNH